MPTSETQYVRSGDVSIAVREHSPSGPGRATVVLVHGYPDQQDTWNRLVERLPLDAWHVVTYDVRGAGASDAPAHREDYLTDRLVDDLVAVLDGVLADGEAAHLVGHDWGSVQLWDAVAAEPTDPRLRDRIASFTSISGPSLDHAAWLARHPAGRQLPLLRQMAHSWYISLFNLPVLPEQLWRLTRGPVVRVLELRQGLPRGHWGPELRRNAVNGLNLYRANIRSGPRRTGRVHVDIPVLVVQPVRDPFITEVMLQDLDDVCSDLRVERLDAGHWVIVTHAEDLARILEEHVRAAAVRR
jgi:pimeloyl-ACP methyl ester carboxylesterase